MDNYYSIGELGNARKDFRAVFNTGLGAFLEDNKIIATLKFLLIDIVKFDIYLRKEHPDMLDPKFSMNEILRTHYGNAALILVDKLTLQ